MTDTTTAVQNGVNAYAAAESALQTAHDQLLLLPSVYQALYENKVIGYLEFRERASQANALAGDCASTLNSILTNHQSDTARAQALNIDLPAPPVTDDVVHPDGGSR